jgi:hypothetical protein
MSYMLPPYKIDIPILMCGALPPTLEKKIMDLGGYVAIRRYIVFLAPRATL